MFHVTNRIWKGWIGTPAPVLCFAERWEAGRNRLCDDDDGYVSSTTEMMAVLMCTDINDVHVDEMIVLS